MQRPQKVIRLDYCADTGAAISVLGDPEEIRLAASGASFLGVRPDGLTLAGGFPSVINVQGMSDSFRFAGLLQDLPFPLTLMPSTAATPIPRQRFKPPFAEQMGAIAQLSVVASMLVR